MFKISIVDTPSHRTLVLEGTLVRPWTAEVETAWKSAGEQLQGRKLVVDLRNVTQINRDGENTLLRLMEDGAKFSCKDVLTKHVLKQLARRCGCTPRSSGVSISTGLKRLSSR
jgi:hypothetical protein